MPSASHCAPCMLHSAACRGGGDAAQAGGKVRSLGSRGRPAEHTWTLLWAIHKRLKVGSWIARAKLPQRTVSLSPLGMLRWQRRSRHVRHAQWVLLHATFAHYPALCLKRYMFIMLHTMRIVRCWVCLRFGSGAAGTTKRHGSRGELEGMDGRKIKGPHAQRQSCRGAALGSARGGRCTQMRQLSGKTHSWCPLHLAVCGAAPS